MTGWRPATDRKPRSLICARDARFNLIVAADVFVYCADLTLIASLV